MGDPACWLHLTCASCGAVDDHLDDDGRCPACRPGEPGDDPGQPQDRDHQPRLQEPPASSPEPRQ